MKRIIIICEGQTEKEFCQKVLEPYLRPFGINIQAPLIKKSMGGIVPWPNLKKEIEIYLNEPKVVVSTFIDYYGLREKLDFPEWENAHKIVDKNERISFLENAMKADIVDNKQFRFLPYMQLHEFEGLLFNNIRIFYDQFLLAELIGIEELKSTFAEYENPEMINNTRETSPSHRLERIIKGYNKPIYGSCIAEAIGIERIRAKSPRFNEWVEKLINC